MSRLTLDTHRGRFLRDLPSSAQQNWVGPPGRQNAATIEKDPYREMAAAILDVVKNNAPWLRYYEFSCDQTRTTI